MQTAHIFRVLAVVLALGAFSQAQAAVVLSDNFNSENGGIGVLNYSNFANWNVTGGSVDIIGNGFFDLLPGNGLYVDMDGSTGTAGTLTSKALFPAGSYTLDFDLAGSQRGPNGIVQLILGNLNIIIDLLSSDPFTPMHFPNITVANPDHLVFASQVPGSLGALLDNVVLTSDNGVATIPEPASLTLLGVGALGAAFMRRRAE